MCVIVPSISRESSGGGKNTFEGQNFLARGNLEEVVCAFVDKERRPHRKAERLERKGKRK